MTDRRIYSIHVQEIGRVYVQRKGTINLITGSEPTVDIPITKDGEWYVKGTDYYHERFVIAVFYYKNN